MRHVLSSPHEAISRLSGLKAPARTQLTCPARLNANFWVGSVQILTVLSSEVVSSMRPSVENVTQRTAALWALRTVDLPSLLVGVARDQPLLPGPIPKQDNSRGRLPDADRGVLGARGDQRVCGREGDRVHRVLVARKPVGAELGLEVPDHNRIVRTAGYQLFHVGVEADRVDTGPVAPEGPLQGRVLGLRFQRRKC